MLFKSLLNHKRLSRVLLQFQCKISTGRVNKKQEAKDVSFTERFNRENKYLFGELISHDRRKSSKQTDKNETTDSQRTDSLSGKVPNEPQSILTSVVDFPLIYSTSDESPFDRLKQHLSLLCEAERFPSVTSILEKSMPPDRRAILEKWKTNMVKEMGEDRFKKYQQDLLTNGSNLHNSINHYLKGGPESDVVIQPGNAGHWKSLKNVFPSLKDIRLLEEFVTHPFLCYRGVVDCFGMYKDNLVIVDWKTSKKAKTSIGSTYDGPLQIAAYAGALNLHPGGQYKVTKGMIVVAYDDGNPATVHFMDEATLENYWRQWLLRLKNYWDGVQKIT